MKQILRKNVAEAAARNAHEAVRIYRIALGDKSVPPWSVLPDDLKAAACADAESVFMGSTASALHAAWRHRRTLAGWRSGPRFDGAAMTDPDMCPWSELPDEERRAWELQRASIISMGAALSTGGLLRGGGGQGRNGAGHRPRERAR